MLLFLSQRFLSAAIVSHSCRAFAAEGRGTQGDSPGEREDIAFLSVSLHLQTRVSSLSHAIPAPPGA